MVGFGKLEEKTLELPAAVQPPSLGDANPLMPTSYQQCGEGYVVAYFDQSKRFFTSYHVGCEHEFRKVWVRRIGFCSDLGYEQQTPSKKRRIGF